MKSAHIAAPLFTLLPALLLGAALPAVVVAAEFRSVSERVAVLYDAPSARATKLFVVSQYYPVEVMVSVDNWLKVRDVSGELAWTWN
jgi:SH3-like domain-containing protein